MITDVVEVAWRAHGSPSALVGTLDGLCARCGTPDSLTVIRKVISRNFTAFDDWCDPAGAGLCRACTWAFRSPILRTIPFLVVRFPEMLTPLATEQLRAQLQKPVPPDKTVVVPLRPGRKHVLSGAAWGHVATDEHLCTWTSDDAHRLDLVEHLLTLGYRASQLLQPAPPYPQTALLTTADAMWALQAWRDLAPWRTRHVWMAVAARALRIEIATQPRIA
ncbi:MAG TPA: hypothetical protein VIU11_22985 [Nakamurella sp.]